MASRAEAKYSITAEDKTRAAFSRVTSRFRRLGETAANTGKSSMMAFGNLKTVLAGVVAGAGFGKITGLLEGLDELGKLNDKLGGSVEQLSRWRFVADKAGIANATFAKGLQKMRINMSMAARLGKGEQFEAFRNLNIDAEKFMQMDFDGQLKRLAVQFNKVDNESRKIDLANAIFGGRATEFLQMFRMGIEGIESELAKADLFGAVRTKQETNLAAAQVDAFTDMNVAFKSLGETIALKLAPSLQASAEKMTKLALAISAHMGPISEYIGKAKRITDKLSGLSGASVPGNMITAFTKSQESGTSFFTELMRAQLQGQMPMLKAIEELKRQAGREIDALLGIEQNTSQPTIAVAG